MSRGGSQDVPCTTGSLRPGGLAMTVYRSLQETLETKLLPKRAKTACITLLPSAKSSYLLLP